MTNLSKETPDHSNARRLLIATLEVLFRVVCIAAGFLLARYILGN
jgi:hypothetical protein